MSDMSIVIVGVVSILSCVSLVTWLARPAEFRVKVAAPVPRPRTVVAAPVAPPPPLPPVARQAVPVLMNALPEKSLSERLAIEPVPRRRSRRSTARSFLSVTNVPTRR